MSSILAAGQQAPEPRGTDNVTTESSASIAFEQGHVLLGGMQGRGKSRGDLLMLAQAQRLVQQWQGEEQGAAGLRVGPELSPEEAQGLLEGILRTGRQAGECDVLAGE
ncbi:hypothetical protein ACFY2W_36155 [Streptomyces sp. NPDC001262]|uniref:hypothetical protein n=1 Tax=Streptomyces sp. NPDC001262 TaxID=3364552 RepID=UPI0036851F6A